MAEIQSVKEMGWLAIVAATLGCCCAVAAKWARLFHYSSAAAAAVDASGVDVVTRNALRLNSSVLAGLPRLAGDINVTFESIDEGEALRLRTDMLRLALADRRPLQYFADGSNSAPPPLCRRSGPVDPVLPWSSMRRAVQDRHAGAALGDQKDFLAALLGVISLVVDDDPRDVAAEKNAWRSSRELFESLSRDVGKDPAQARAWLMKDLRSALRGEGGPARAQLIAAFTARACSTGACVDKESEARRPRSSRSTDAAALTGGGAK